MAKPHLTIEQRFWAKVRKRDGCWEWTGAKNADGYGMIGVNGVGHKRHAPAHRVSWELHYGHIPTGMWVLHHCDNPPCIRPDHLFIGDRSANMKDCAAKGRLTGPQHKRGITSRTHCVHGHELTPDNSYVHPCGRWRYCLECHRVGKMKARQRALAVRGPQPSHTKLDECAVRRIREEVALGSSIRGAARRYGVAQRTVQHVLRGNTWRHVA
jgi:hypothetical protein